MTDPVGIGVQGQKPKYAFMVKDEFTGLKHMFALHAKSTETHQQAISFRLGQKTLHTDTFGQQCENDDCSSIFGHTALPS